MNRKSIPFLKKKVFVGIDLHRQSLTVCCICEGQIVKRCTMLTSGKFLVSFLKKHFKGAIISTAYEAGFSGFWLHRYLIAQGISNIVVHAASIETEARNRVKTDKRDSKKIAEQLAQSRLKGIYIPSIEQECSRLFTRTREQVKQKRGRVMNQIRMKLHQFGRLDPSYHQRLSFQAVDKAIAHAPQELCRVVELLVSQWKGYNRELAILDKHIRAQYKDNPLSESWKSLPGFGVLSAQILSNELGDMSQFPNERTLSSFAGLTPSEFSSGDKTHRGHISRQGSPRLRAILVQAAWRAIRQDPELELIFNRIAARATKKKAIVAIARKLLGRARAVLREQTLYQISYTEAA